MITLAVSKFIRDSGLDALLDLNGQIYVIDHAGKHWVKFIVKRVEPSSERPHGLRACKKIPWTFRIPSPGHL